MMKLKTVVIPLKEKHFKHAVKFAEEKYSRMYHCPIALAIDSAIKVKPGSYYAAQVTDTVGFLRENDEIDVALPKRIQRFIDKFDTYVDKKDLTEKEKKRLYNHLKRSFNTNFKLKIPHSLRPKKKKVVGN